MTSGKWFLAVSLLAVVGLLLAGCAPAAAPAPQPTAKAAVTQEAKPPGAPAATPKPAAEQPKSGGVLTISSVGNPPSLDVHQETSQNTWMILSPAYNMLVEYQPSQGKGLFPGLAEAWDISKDGLVYTFKIRKGVKFHDGSPLTPGDVVFSLTRLWKPPRGVSSALGGVLEAVKSIETTGDQVKMSLDYPYSPMMSVLSYSPTVIYPKSVVEAKGDMKNTVVGTGPFAFKSYTPGLSAEVVRNPNYWLAGRPYLDRVVFPILRDNATRLSALRTGKVNMTGRSFSALAPSEMELVKKEKPNLVFYPSATPNYPSLYLNIRNKPLSDKRVRQAISLSIDRQAALNVIGEGKGRLARLFNLEGWGIPEDERVKLPGYRQPKDADIAEAKKLMAEAGYAEGFKLNILARTVALSKDSAVFLTSQLSKVGVDAKVEVVEDAIFWDRGRNAKHEAMLYFSSLAIPDVEIIGRFLIKGGSLNYSGNDDDQKLNELWQKQRRTMDEKERKAIVEEVERHVLAEAQPHIPLLVPFFFLAVWPEVRNFSPGITEYGNNNLQEIWLAR
ncbi:MAG: ABC transporter substrate-binding protein [Chloroflexi bacterium]|nr:ABC transporter substrate-binding protein [Chloroflexota bacterium]